MKKRFASPILILFAAAFMAAVCSQPAAAQTGETFSCTLQAKSVWDGVELTWKIAGNKGKPVTIVRAANNSKEFTEFTVAYTSGSKKEYVSPGASYTYMALYQFDTVNPLFSFLPGVEVQRVSITIPLTTPDITRVRGKDGVTLLIWRIAGGVAYEVYNIDSGKSVLVNAVPYVNPIRVAVQANKWYKVRAVSASNVYSEYSHNLLAE